MLKAMLTKTRSKKGFTLMEMLVVVAIIAILIAIAIPTFGGALTKAHKAVDQANIRSAYAQFEVEKMTEETPATALPTDDTTALAYVVKMSGSPLEYYAGVDFDVKPWVGTGTKKAGT